MRGKDREKTGKVKEGKRKVKKEKKGGKVDTGRQGKV